MNNYLQLKSTLDLSGGFRGCLSTEKIGCQPIIWPICFRKLQMKNEQECIPVGCVPAAHWPYAAVSLVPGGSPWSGGRVVCLVGGGVGGRLGGLLGPGGGGVVCLVRGWSAWSGGGVSAWFRGGGSPETPPVGRILDTRLWKYYLGPTSLRPVKKWTGDSSLILVNHSVLDLNCFPLKKIITTSDTHRRNSTQFYEW